MQTVLGQEHLQALLDKQQTFIPCYWHQQQIFCVRLLLDAAASNENLKLAYLISPSKDGDMATRMFSHQGVHIIRGSATRGGAQALREIYMAIRQQNLSPIVTPDGPTGPIYKCKPGVAMLAHLSRAPVLPLAYAGSRVWKLRSWDRFMLPCPFSRVVIGVGPIVQIDKNDADDDYVDACRRVDENLNTLFMQCQNAIDTSEALN